MNAKLSEIQTLHEYVIECANIHDMKLSEAHVLNLELRDYIKEFFKSKRK